LFSKKCFLQVLIVRWKWLPITITFFYPKHDVMVTGHYELEDPFIVNWIW
jgi:hypothetical protein